MLVRLSVGFLLSFTFESRSYFPDPFVCCIVKVVGCPARDGYQRFCLCDEAVDFFLYEGAVGGLECVHRLYFFRVAGIVFGIEEGVHRI